MSLEEMIDGWQTLADAVVATATTPAPRAEVGDTADVPRTRPCVDSRHEGQRAHRARQRACMA